MEDDDCLELSFNIKICNIVSKTQENVNPSLYSSIHPLQYKYRGTLYIISGIAHLIVYRITNLIGHEFVHN